MAKKMAIVSKSELVKLLFQAKTRQVQVLQERLQICKRDKKKTGEALQQWVNDIILRGCRAAVKAEGITLDREMTLKDFEYSHGSQARIVKGAPVSLWTLYQTAVALCDALAVEIRTTEKTHDTLRAEVEMSEVIDADLHAMVLNFIKEVK